MQISIKPEDERFLEERARELGYADASDYFADLVKKEKQCATATRGERAEQTRRWIERIRGTATSDLTTDQIMDMTRSEV